jgi:NaMN:DMB phosphoribosyltransferase
MMPAFAGLVVGAARRVPVLMAGGTQMGAILAIVRALDRSALNNVAIGTTRWLLSDGTADLRGIVAQVADVPILAADLDFSGSRFEGLRAYERGFVKEGVGAGGAVIAAMAKSRGSISREALLKEVEGLYEDLVLRWR